MASVLLQLPQTHPMNRIPSNAYAVEIGLALRVVPARIRTLLRNPHFLCGVDPVFAGLHDYTDTDDGRSYKDTAHCVYPFHQRLHRADRHVTVVLPTPTRYDAVIHELGHALDYSLGFTHTAEPITDYAETDRYEAFAEAFTGYLLHGYDQLDDATTALFDSLGR